MRRYLPELVALPMLPLLIVQGKRTRSITPQLPEAGGAAEGFVERKIPDSRCPADYRGVAG